MKELLTEESLVNLYFIYQFIRRLVTPFKDTEAFKLGIIDDRGNILRKSSTLKTQKEKDAFTMFDTLVFNLKKILEKLPFGQTKLASYAAALWLLRESKNPQNLDDDDMIYEDFVDLYDILRSRIDESEVNTLMESVKKFSEKEARELGDSLNISWSKVDIQQFIKGLSVEQEHDKDPETNVVHGDMRKVGKIAWAHLKEIPDYYTRLEKMESESEKVVEDGPIANGVGDGSNIAGLNANDVFVPLDKKLKKRKKLEDWEEKGKIDESPKPLNSFLLK